MWGAAGGDRVSFATGPVGVPSAWRPVSRAAAHLSPVERFQILLPLLEADDPAAFDMRPAAVASVGRRIVQSLTAVVTGEERIDGGIAATLGAAWGRSSRRDRALLSAALVLCIDHELNVFVVARDASSGRITATRLGSFRQ